MLGNNTDMIKLDQIHIWIASSSKLGIASASLKKSHLPSIGCNLQAKKKLLKLLISENRDAKFWLYILKMIYKPCF